MKTAFQIVLSIAIIVLGYMCYESIQRPVRFDREFNERRDKVIDRLRDIRTAQLAYRSIHREFTGSFDTLINFIANDSLALVRMEGMITDSMLEAGITDRIALEMGLITRDTLRVSVRDSLFRRKPWIVDSIRYVPYAPGTEFELGATILETASGVDVPVFEAKVHNNVFTKGLNRQEVININHRLRELERYPGLRVGSLEEANNSAGNWE
ncbi:hypothetical protein [Alkalitalea saponilacus]|uniref:Uncharacterized protein n=1 Tax=Alkalitalea saponilacus TaxID=889453 RepID=A0A1T5H9T8_9BACT|nr:hypothetical protein [Alkalitalea saponilacus]ASB50820.1 hypothetical protein CDL62_17500 [Alkalitalea saponilacus]SKC17301.1 hypothetical protein SAMN03080601_02158 [Alkalitalea saponilacus]